MKIYVNKLTNFKLSHGEEAEFAIQNALAKLYNLNRGTMTFGYNSDYDFILNNTKIELKISSYAKGTLELCRADYSPSGLSISKSDIYLFLNPSGKTAKFRAVSTAELSNVYLSAHASQCRFTKTVGDKIGSCLIDIDFKLLNDIMIAECDYYKENGTTVFDIDTIRTNKYAKKFIGQVIQ